MEPTSTHLDPDGLARLAIEALERTAFVLADPCEDPSNLPTADTFARIGFSGPSNEYDIFAPTTATVASGLSTRRNLVNERLPAMSIITSKRSPSRVKSSRV